MRIRSCIEISTNIDTTEKKTCTRILVDMMQNSRLQNGGWGEKVALYASTCVHVVISPSIN